MKTLVLLSGGMDSVTAFHWARAEHEVVGAVSFDYGAKHNHREIPLAAWHCAETGVHHDVIELDFVNRLFASDLLKSGGEVPEGHYADENMKKTVVPFRNGIMLAIACGIAESREAEGLVIAAHAGDHTIYPDCREPFMQGMAAAMREGLALSCGPVEPSPGRGWPGLVVDAGSPDLSAGRRAFVDQQDLGSGLGCGHCRGDACRAGADDREIMGHGSVPPGPGCRAGSRRAPVRDRRRRRDSRSSCPWHTARLEPGRGRTTARPG